MRDILFRGKRKDNGEWVYGYVYRIWERVYILWGMTNDVPTMIEVDPETVGQYTELHDSNGKRMFEHDIVKCGDIIGIINFNEGCYCVKTNKPDWRGRNNPAIDIVLNEYMNEIEVIGTIHDNPELLQMEG